MKPNSAAAAPAPATTDSAKAAFRGIVEPLRMASGEASSLRVDMGLNAG